MHILPQLRKLEEKYADVLTVIGVHSAKFPAERESDNLRLAVLRYRVEHPVFNDRHFLVWQAYSVNAWPTLIFVDPQGNIMGKHEGEFPLEVLDSLLAEMVEVFARDNLLERRRLIVRRQAIADAPLRFPGKVLADPASRRLFIADSNHHRLLVATLGGEVSAIIGSGEPGLRDGDFASAQFNQPQGLALGGDTLYVADTENHALRAVDLAGGTVRTVAGTGEQAREYVQGAPPLATPLSSPWDVALSEQRVYIAMAGAHEIWDLDLTTGRIGTLIGSGQEGLQDGSFEEAMLAQTSGVATDGPQLYFADSETSSIRHAALDTWQVTTIVGEDLFVFGDIDGVGRAVRLQHPLGLCVVEGVLYVADSYNHKVKRLDPTSRRMETLAGTGQPGLKDGPAGVARFHEPGGLSFADGKLYVADTNNHAIRVIDLGSGEVSTLALKGAGSPAT